MTTERATPTKPRGRRKSAHIWHLVTNHQNMLYMLAAGLVMGPAGFRGKHYSDPLDVYPGWIPLFRDTAGIPADALNHATSERKHLLPCVASFDLNDVSGTFQMLPCKGKTRVVTCLPKSKGKNEIAALLRAPMPLSLLSAIHFRSHEDMQEFKSAAGDVSNVDLSSLHIGVLDSLFSTATDTTWPPKEVNVELSENDKPPAFGLALGGAIAMLYHAANRSDMGLSVFRMVTRASQDTDHELTQSDPVLAELSAWMDGREISGQADIRARLFWGVIQALVTTQTEKCPQTAVDVALSYLEAQLDLLQETEFRPRLERLIADMRGFLGLGAGTITELLERHKGTVSRPLLLFCLREHCTDLLEFSHPLLNDAEYLLAGVLFGVRDSWLQLPTLLRDPEISSYVADRMAEAAHGKQCDTFALRTGSHPKPLRELFTSPSGDWNRTQKRAALDIARKCNWNDCIQTKITLAEGNLPERFERKGSQLVLPGRVTTAEEVDMGKFLQRLGQWPPVDRQIESEARKRLVISQEVEQKAERDNSA